ncbi:MAG: hypothetical protein AMXMBFR84_03100 [Candidatus Hydrogenedentota bacterium]
MSKIGKAFLNAGKAIVSDTEPSEYKAADKAIVCHHCGGTQFHEGSAQLNTALMTLAGLDWANESATTLACSTCGRIEWFLTSPERLAP